MPTPNKGEKERDFVSRCVPMLIKEGKPHDQAIATCYSVFDQHKKKMEMSHAAIVFSADDSAFRDAITLGQGLPSEKEGQPVRYFWKEVLRPGTFQDKSGTQHTVTASRIENLIRNFDRAKVKGFLPSLPSRHEKDGASNFGFVIGAQKNSRGGLELLNQFIGDDAIKAAARNKSSICTIQNYTDETGETFDELIDHNAIVPDPQLSNLDDFRPALAASRGTVASAVVLSLAASKEPEMDLTKLREAVGAAKEITDEQVIAQATSKLCDLVQTKATLELSRTNLSGEVTTLKSRAESAESKLLELSKGSIPADYIPREVGLAKREIALALQQGRCVKPAADYLTEVIEKDGKPTPEAGLMLSRVGTFGSAIDVALKVMEFNKALDGFRHTESQPVPRNTPGANDQAVSPERIKELRALAGVK